LKIKYFECSSKLGTNINDAFVDLATQLLNVDFPENEIKSLNLTNEHLTDIHIVNNSSSCCIIN
jgi:hypothetical protein